LVEEDVLTLFDAKSSFAIKHTFILEAAEDDPKDNLSLTSQAFIESL